MDHFDFTRLQDLSRADIPNASSYSDMDRDVFPNANLDDDVINTEHSGQNQSSESMRTQGADQRSLEHTQNLYYTRGLQEIENLQLLDLSPLATWKLSSYKQGHGLAQLRDDSPEMYWQSDGSMENSVEQSANAENAQLNQPHSILLQFSKKVSLERISLFTNYQLDESYTPSKIKIMAGGSIWDLTEVCVVNFEKPMGWSHIIFKGVRGDGLLKCFVVKIIILANHQDGKDSHIRAIRCFGKKSNLHSVVPSIPDTTSLHESGSLPVGLSNESENMLNNQDILLKSASRSHYRASSKEVHYEEPEQYYKQDSFPDEATSQILHNVNEVLRFNSGFESIEFKSISSIR